MTTLVDIVNFNADASCLPAAAWLKALSGGSRSMMCQWLRLFVECGRRVVIGFTGATIADLASLNPEAIDLVNAHPDVFEAILRPFSHDIALLRSPAGFALNVALGRRAVEKEFRRVAPYFLPPEFMLTNAQIRHLGKAGIRGTFVNAVRFKAELRSRIPSHPYFVRGIFSSSLRCIPIEGDLSEAYLRSLHLWDVVPWNQLLRELTTSVAFSWRDGESILFVPDGIDRERVWLEGECPEIKRALLSDIEPALDFRRVGPETDNAYLSYPVHSFSEWIQEFRMIGYLQRLANLEDQLDSFDVHARTLWLQAINSDVFSAVEKDSPVITLRTAPPTVPGGREIRWTLQRSERGFEGEEFLELLERGRQADCPVEYSALDQTPFHIEKLRIRTAYVASLHGQNRQSADVDAVS